MDLNAQLGELGEDLITRQVNLIIATGGMSAEPMPDDPVRAMRQIYRLYYDRLLGVPGADTDTRIASMGAADLETEFTQLAQGLKSTSHETRRALAGLAPPPVNAPSARLVLRIRETALLLAGLAANVNRNIALTPHDKAALRKAWEIGTDEVVLQTTIALDGDVVLRADSRYSTEAQQALFALHDQSCATAMRTWKDVVGAAIDLITGLLKKADS